jgi:hypothetical protein
LTGDLFWSFSAMCAVKTIRLQAMALGGEAGVAHVKSQLPQTWQRELPSLLPKLFTPYEGVRQVVLMCGTGTTTAVQAMGATVLQTRGASVDKYSCEKVVAFHLSTGSLPIRTLLRLTDAKKVFVRCGEHKVPWCADTIYLIANTGLDAIYTGPGLEKLRERLTVISL